MPRRTGSSRRAVRPSPARLFPRGVSTGSTGRLKLPDNTPERRAIDRKHGRPVPCRARPLRGVAGRGQVSQNNLSLSESRSRLGCPRALVPLSRPSTEPTRHARFPASRRDRPFARAGVKHCRAVCRPGVRLPVAGRYVSCRSRRRETSRASTSQSGIIYSYRL